MHLKQQQEHQKGTCQVKTCEYTTAAFADGKTFFSKRASTLELCEDHLFQAQEMAEAQGLTLVWQEYQAPAQETALVPVDEVKKQLAEEASLGEQTFMQIQAFVIETKEDLDFAAEVLADTKKTIKRLDDKRKEITGPLNEALKAANALFKPAIGFYEQCEKLIKAKISAAHAKAEEIARQALENASNAAVSGDSAGLTTALEVHDAAVQFPTVDGIQYRSSWKFEIVNEKEIPREFLTPDLRLIQSVVMHKKGATEIPGVRVFEEKIIASVASS